MINKLILICFLVSLASCSVSKIEDLEVKANELCKEHGGYKNGDIADHQAVCVDTTKVNL